MTLPFEKIVEHLESLDRDDATKTLGSIAEDLGGVLRGVTAQRVADAIMCIRMMRGESTYVSAK